jgi:hypothetical protein
MNIMTLFKRQLKSLYLGLNKQPFEQLFVIGSDNFRFPEEILINITFK